MNEYNHSNYKNRDCIFTLYHKMNSRGLKLMSPKLNFNI